MVAVGLAAPAAQPGDLPPAAQRLDGGAMNDETRTMKSDPVRSRQAGANR